MAKKWKPKNIKLTSISRLLKWTTPNCIQMVGYPKNTKEIYQQMLIEKANAKPGEISN